MLDDADFRDSHLSRPIWGSQGHLISMARRLHNLEVRTTAWAVVVTASWCTGCVAPPIEPEPEDLNLAPYLDFMTPENPFVTLDSADAVEFRVRAFDANEADETLYFVWVGEQIEGSQGQVTRETGGELENGVYHPFQPIDFEVSACDARLRGVTRETLWVFVSDGPFLSRTGTEIEVAEDRYLTSFTWVLNIRPDACL